MRRAVSWQNYQGQILRGCGVVLRCMALCLQVADYELLITPVWLCIMLINLVMLASCGRGIVASFYRPCGQMHTTLWTLRMLSSVHWRPLILVFITSSLGLLYSCDMLRLLPTCLHLLNTVGNIDGTECRSTF